MKWFSLTRRNKSKSSPPSTPSPPATSPLPPAAAVLQVQHPGDLRRLFDNLDADGDGRISSADLESHLRLVGGGSPDPAGDAAAMVRAADSDGDGYISLEEFTATVCGGGGDGDDLRGAFEVYDLDGDGVISAVELHRVLSGVMGEGAATLAECEGMIRAVDRNGDGAVSFDEFRSMMTRRSPA
uniref:Putative calcium-binding protein CML10 n=1 Tax=Anthurium amnicola TaxID=1678845 RepID=A0A1D1XRU1_9ARAE